MILPLTGYEFTQIVNFDALERGDAAAIETAARCLLLYVTELRGDARPAMNAEMMPGPQLNRWAGFLLDRCNKGKVPPPE